MAERNDLQERIGDLKIKEETVGISNFTPSIQWYPVPDYGSLLWNPATGWAQQSPPSKNLRDSQKSTGKNTETEHDIDASKGLMYVKPNVADENEILELIRQWIAEDQFSSDAPTVKGEPSACLFVASLNVMKSESELTESVKDHFLKYGQLMNVKVLKDPANRPYAFVQFEKIEDANRAMIEANHSLLDGRHIRIELAKVNRSIWITGIPSGIRKDQFQSIIEIVGPIEEIVWSRQSLEGLGMLNVVIRFCYREDAVRIFNCLRSVSPWNVEWAASSSQSSSNLALDGHSIFVGQLNRQEVTEEKLRTKFSKYGEIDKIQLMNKIPSSSESKSKYAFAFIRFKSAEAASNAISSENRTVWLENQIKVMHRKIQPRRTSSAPSSFSRSSSGQYGLMPPETLSPPNYMYPGFAPGFVPHPGFSIPPFMGFAQAGSSMMPIFMPMIPQSFEHLSQQKRDTQIYEAPPSPPLESQKSPEKDKK